MYAYMYIDCRLYSKTCLKQPLKKEDQLSVIAGQKYCSILQPFLPSFSYHLLLRFLFCLFLSGCLRQVLLYWQPTCTFCRLAVRWIFLLKRDFFTTTNVGSTGPTALESEGPYFVIMGQWPGPTINLKACILSGTFTCFKKTFFFSFTYLSDSVLTNFIVFNIAKKLCQLGNLPDSVKLACASPFVDALGTRDSVKLKPKSNARPPDKSAYWKIIFFISHPKHKAVVNKAFKLSRSQLQCIAIQ